MSSLWSVLLVAHCANAISFNLERAEKFCLGEDVTEGDTLIGTWKYDSGSGKQGEVVLTVYDGMRSLKYESKEETGSFSLDVKEDAMYDVCFWNTGSGIRAVTMTISSELPSKAAGDKVKQTQVKPLQQQMDSILSMTQHLVNDLEHIKKREWEMRDLNEMTNTRLVQWGFFAILVFVAAGIFEVWYLGRFFHKKKLI